MTFSMHLVGRLASRASVMPLRQRLVILVFEKTGPELAETSANRLRTRKEFVRTREFLHMLVTLLKFSARTRAPGATQPSARQISDICQV